jgi:DNA-directed RNA polymerase specialized sigma subunit
MSEDEETIDEFLEATQEKAANTRYQELRGRRGQELQMWEKWNSNGRKPEDLEPLLKSLKPTVTAEAKRRMAGLGGAIPRVALEAELMTHTVDALHKYDPNHTSANGKRTQLNTFVHNNFQRVTDYVAGRRNIARLPKANTAQYQTFQNAKTQFMEEHGREPSSHELKTLLPQMTLKDIQKAQNAFAPEAFSGVSELEHDAGMRSDVHRSAVVLMRSRMSPEVQQFADLHYPEVGKKPKTVQQIAKTLGIPEHKAYRLRTAVDKLIGPIVKEE